jgi:hypothetical protein
MEVFQTKNFPFFGPFPKNFFQKFSGKGPKTSKNFARKWQKFFYTIRF